MAFKIPDPATTPVLGVYGSPGTGKTNWVVHTQYLPAIKAGQHVYTNIRGILELSCLEATANLLGLPLEEVQSLVHSIPTKKDDFFAKANWPDPDYWANNPTAPLTGYAGSLLLIDEAATFFQTTRGIPEHVLQYLTQIRHGVDAKGNTGRCVVIAQVATTVCDAIRGLMPRQYVFEEPGNAGFFARAIGRDAIRYIFTATGCRPQTGKGRNYSSFDYIKWSREVFACYKSNSRDSANQTKTTVSFFSKSVVFALVAVVCLFAWGGPYLVHRLGDGFLFKNSSDYQAPSLLNSSTSTSTSTPSTHSTPSTSSTTPLLNALKNEAAAYSTTHKLLGWTYSGSRLSILTIDTSTSVRRWWFEGEYARFTIASPMSAQLELYDGTKITQFTGTIGKPTQPQNAGFVPVSPTPTTPHSSAIPANR